MCLFLRWMAAVLLVVTLAGCSSPKPPASATRSTALVSPSVVAPKPVQAGQVQTVQSNQPVVTNPPSVPQPVVQPPTAPKPAVANATPLPPATTLPPATNGVTPKPKPESRSEVANLPEWVDMKQWCAQNCLAQVEINRNATGFSLRSSKGNLDFIPKSQTARWKGAQFLLAYAPQITRGKCFVHKLDIQHNVLPLLRSPDCLGKNSKILVIDPGHGGEPGSRSVVGNFTEKQLTLDWALRTKALLAEQGWKVYLTRTNDVEVPLTNRVAFAEKVHADLFVSLHFNSSHSATQCGVETYCTTPHGMQSHLVRGSEDTKLQVNNAYDADNLRWALQIHREIASSTQALDRGVRRARFIAVLRMQQRPALLVEGGYLSNRREATQIITEAYRQKLAEGLARALLKK